MKKVSVEKADKLAGIRVDRRVKQYYAMDNEKPCEISGAILFKNAKATGVCSGCSGDDDYGGQSVGCGCYECGGTGKRVNHFPVPAYFLSK